VNPAKIVVGEMQRKRGLHIFQLFGERIRQASKSTKLHSDRKVLTFDVRR
jgi:hypothetical protein